MLFSAPENEITLPRPADDGGWVREKLHSAAINLLDFENLKISNFIKTYWLNTSYIILVELYSK